MHNLLPIENWALEIYSPKDTSPVSPFKYKLENKTVAK